MGGMDRAESGEPQGGAPTSRSEGPQGRPFRAPGQGSGSDRWLHVKLAAGLGALLLPAAGTALQRQGGAGGGGRGRGGNRNGYGYGFGDDPRPGRRRRWALAVWVAGCALAPVVPVVIAHALRGGPGA